jgi:hypothetical protein
MPCFIMKTIYRDFSHRALLNYYSNMSNIKNIKNNLKNVLRILQTCNKIKT